MNLLFAQLLLLATTVVAIQSPYEWNKYPSCFGYPSELIDYMERLGLMKRLKDHGLEFAVVQTVEVFKPESDSYSKHRKENLTSYLVRFFVKNEDDDYFKCNAQLDHMTESKDERHHSSKRIQLKLAYSKCHRAKSYYVDEIECQTFPSCDTYPRVIVDLLEFSGASKKLECEKSLDIVFIKSVELDQTFDTDQYDVEFYAEPINGTITIDRYYIECSVSLMAHHNCDGNDCKVGSYKDLKCNQKHKITKFVCPKDSKSFSQFKNEL